MTGLPVERVVERIAVGVRAPGHARRVEVVEQRARMGVGVGAVAAGDAVGGAEQEEVAVGPGAAARRREVSIVDRERVREPVVEGDVGRVVVAHHEVAVAAGRVGAVRDEAVHRAAVDLPVHLVPLVPRILVDAGRVEVKRRHGDAVLVLVRERRRDRLHLFLSRVVKLAEQVVEGPVLLHDHHHVLDRDGGAGRLADRERLRRQHPGGERAAGPGVRARIVDPGGHALPGVVDAGLGRARVPAHGHGRGGLGRRLAGERREYNGRQRAQAHEGGPTEKRRHAAARL